MSVQNSINFIKKAGENNKFRQSINSIKPDDLASYLQNIGYDFTDYEFEESINILHVKCQFEEQAIQLKEIAMWYKLLTNNIY